MYMYIYMYPHHGTLRLEKKNVANILVSSYDKSLYNNASALMFHHIELIGY